MGSQAPPFVSNSSTPPLSYPSPPPPPGEASSSSSFCSSWWSPATGPTAATWRVAVALLPPGLVAAYLLRHLTESLQKLARSRSRIMSVYYALLWGVALLNTIRCIVEVLEGPTALAGEPGPAAAAAAAAVSAARLATQFGTELLEVSVVALLSVGFLASGWGALLRTLAASAALAALDAAAKALLVFHWGVPLFAAPPPAGVGGGGPGWRKWGFWSVHGAAFGLVYLLILLAPYSEWRDRLPARPAFYKYAGAMLALHVTAALGSLSAGAGLDLGLCLFGLATYAYYAVYPPLVYVTFLSDFFKEDDMQMEDAYYSEMKDAGYFDADWE